MGGRVLIKYKKMASGNFLIGNDLSMEGFNRYVQPFLEEKGYSIKDKLFVPHQDHKTILSSIVGKGNLEIEINKMLVEVGQLIEKNEGKKKNRIAWEHQIIGWQEDVSVRKGRYETIGVYQDNNAASQFFPSIAQEYLLDGIQQKAEEVVEEIKSLLDQSLSDLAQQ